MSRRRFLSQPVIHRFVKLNQVVSSPGLYVHVPFCVQKCGYCDFYSVTDLERIDAYVAGVIKEMDDYRSKLQHPDSLYFGGGTPSLLSPAQVERIIDAAAEGFSLTPDAEITLEVNPGTVTQSLFYRFKVAGVNRLSIGVQSFADSNLRFLGRIHSKDQACAAISDARREGFHNLGLDLIYGLPGQTMDSWHRDLAFALSWEPAHISCYMLSYEEHTPLWNAWKRNEFKPLSDDAVADLYLFMTDFLLSNGYAQYEISNFAKSRPSGSEDYRSRHNRKYWDFTPYFGFGPSAHSMKGDVRWWNHPDLLLYLEAIATGRAPVSGSEHLSTDQRAIEALYLSLRQNQGLDLDRFFKVFGIKDRPAIEMNVALICERGWLIENEGNIRLTTEGMLRLDAIVRDLAALF